jgi:hypothetical protein
VISLFGANNREEVAKEVALFFILAKKLFLGV